MDEDRRRCARKVSGSWQPSHIDQAERCCSEAYDHLRGKLEAELGWTSPTMVHLKRNDQYATLKRNYHESRSFSSKIFGATTESDEAHPLAAIYWPLASIDDAGRNMTIHAPVGHPVIQNSSRLDRQWFG